MGDDPYSQSSDHRLFHSLSSRNPVIRRPDGVINGTRRGYKRPARRGRINVPGGAINDTMPDGVSLFRYPTGYRKHATPGGVINDLPGGVINDLHTDIRRGIAFNNLMAERASHSASTPHRPRDTKAHAPLGLLHTQTKYP